MSDARPAAVVIGALRRQWWLVAIVVLAALVAGYFAAADIETSYQGSARVVINTAYANKPGYPGQDQMVNEVKTAEEYRSLVTSETGLSAEDLSSGMDAYTTGDPQDRLYVTYESPDEQRAEQVAAGMGRAAAARALELSAGEIEKARTARDLTLDIIRQVEETEFMANSMRTQSEADLVKRQTLYNYSQALVSQQSGLDAALSVYTYDGNVTVTKKAASTALRNVLVGAGFVGLVLGLGLAALREVLAWRGAARSEG